MTGTPAISVLMTVYNAGRHLGPAIDSILSQSFRDYEFIIVDDASTDGSLDLLRRYQEVDTRVRLIENTENKGQTACLNQGLREARGKWIARQDADDISLPRRLAAQWHATCESPELVLVGVNGWIIDGEGAVTGMIHAPLHDAGIRWAMPWRNPFIHTGVMFRAGDWLYDEAFRICQDWEFWSRLAERGCLMNLPNRLVAYRHNDHSLSHTSKEKTEAESTQIVERIWIKTFSKVSPRQELLKNFREGLSVENRRAFWKYYNNFRKQWTGGSIRQAVAVHRIQAAGAYSKRNLWTLILEVGLAFCDSQTFVLGVLWDCRKFLEEFKSKSDLQKKDFLIL
jgi:glycosyltransferase involved in cell wall biosynthesis